MSSVGQAVGGIVGGVIGFFVGGPTGALYGAQLGMMAGGLIDPPDGPVINGPRLDDLTVQTSTYGAFIPRNYGTVAQHGNIFWLQGDKLTETPRVEESGGKGGPTTTTNTWDYSATFALGLCEGPIDGIRRIWINGQLWYDAGSSDVGGIIASNSVGNQFTLYTGTDTQLPDPLIQADKGAANVPAYRGLAYIVFDNLPLAKYNNSLAGAQIKVEIVKDGVYSDALLERTTIPENPIFHTTYRAAGNQYDSGGGRNYIAALVDSPWAPYWIRQIGTALEVRQLTTDGSVHAITVSLNDMQYAYGKLDYRYVCWGLNGNLSTYDCGAAFKVKSFADGGGNAYLIKESSLIYYLVKIPLFATSTSPPELGAVEVLNINNMLTTWDGKAVTVWRGIATGEPVHIKIYDTIDSVLTLIDSYDVATSEAAYLMDSAESVSQVYDDKLIIATRIGSPTTTNATILIIDLVTKTLLSTHVVPCDFAGKESPFMGSLNVVGNVLYLGQRRVGDPSYHANSIVIDKIASNTVPLSSIVSAECLQSNLLAAADINVTELTDPVRGYRVSSLGALRGGIDPVRAAWPFDVVQNGYKIKFKRRGSASVVTINADELDARAAGEKPGVQITNSREMDTLLPSNLRLKYIDAVREYDTNEQVSDRGL